MEVLNFMLWFDFSYFVFIFHYALVNAHLKQCNRHSVIAVSYKIRICCTKV